MSRDLIIDRADLDTWAGRTLTDTEVERIARCVPDSSIPDAISVIATEAIVRFRWNDHTNDIGNWCPHSEEPVTPHDEPTDSDTDDLAPARCPAGCQKSRPVRDDDEDEGDDGGDGDDGDDGQEDTSDESTQDDTMCDECEETIPGACGGGLANRHHKTGCSLYDPDQD